jgi:molybdopterin molybdotransferase
MIDVCSQETRPLWTIDEASERIKAAIQTVDGLENIPLKNAIGRVLAQPIYSPVNIPADKNAAMDGYALSSKDITPESPFNLRMAGASWAGRPFWGQLQRGQCIRIFTGAVVPEQADSVIMQEHVQVQGQTIHFAANTPARRNIREAGEDIKQGACLIKSPKKLTVYDIGLLASAGIYEVSVKRQLKIIFFSTGDELTALGQPLEAGKIYDSNRYLLNGLLTDAGYNIRDGGVIADNRRLLENAFINAAKDHDVILTTGGASVGEADYIKDILANCGQINFWKIAMKPGKPMAFGTIGSCYFFGLPGNPVAVITTFQQLVAPALKQLAGAPVSKPLRLTATCTSTLKKAPGRQEFQRGILNQDDNGEFLVTSAGSQGSHILSSMSQSNCYIILPTECNGVQAGEKVCVEPFNLFI